MRHPEGTRLGPSFKSGTEHTLKLDSIRLCDQEPLDSVPARVDIAFKDRGKRHIVGSKLITLTREPTNVEVKCQMPRVYKSREFQVFVEFWDNNGKRVASTIDDYCHIVQVERN